MLSRTDIIQKYHEAVANAKYHAKYAEHARRGVSSLNAEVQQRLADSENLVAATLAWVLDKDFKKVVCEACGKEDLAKRTHRRYCNPACRQKAYRRRTKATK